MAIGNLQLATGNWQWRLATGNRCPAQEGGL